MPPPLNLNLNPNPNLSPSAETTFTIPPLVTPVLHHSGASGHCPRTASRPRLAAATNAKRRSNLWPAPYTVERAASQGRLAVRDVSRTTSRLMPARGVLVR